ncbi:MAG: hypothetical protein ACQXXF_07380, partial [Thermoplasmatota archaeon]
MYRKEIIKHNLGIIKKQSSQIELLASLIIIVLVYYFFGAFHYPNYRTPQTDGTLEFVLEQHLIRNVRDYNKIFYWNDKMLLGYPEFFISSGGHPFASLFFISIYKNLEPILLYKYFYFTSTLILILGCFLLIKHLSKNIFFSALLALSISSTPFFIDAVVNGRLRALTADCFIPIILYLALNFNENWKELSLFSAIQMVYHPSITITLLVIINFFILLSLIEESANSKKVSNNIKYFFLFNIFFIILIIYWPFNFMMIKDQLWSESKSAFFSFSMLFSGFINGNLWTTSIFLVILTLSLIVLFLNYKNNVLVKKVLFLYLALIIFSLGYLLLIIKNFWGFFTTSYNKLSRISSVFLLVLTSYALYFGKALKNKNKIKIFELILLICLTIYSLYNLNSSSKKINYGVTESILTSPYFNYWSKEIKDLRAERFFSYGIYSLAFDPAMQFFSNKSTISFGVWELSGINIHRKIRPDEVFGSPFKINEDTIFLNMPLSEFKNYLKLSGVKYIFLYLCGNQISYYTYSLLSNFSELKTNDSCTFLFEMNASFVDAPSHIVFEDHLKEPLQEQISIREHLNYANKEYLTLNYERENPEKIIIYTKNITPNTLIRVKEQYNPYWKEYDDQ